MASLIQFLAAGVKGAESGSCTIVLRGTATSAAAFLWNEFEEITQPGVNTFPLDANGGLEIYTDALVDVQVLSAASLVLRNVTVGHSAPVVEVESASFLGTDYDGSPANTAGQPTTLQAILDKWITSAGATDWNVDVDGIPTSIQEAISGVTGLGVNVKSSPFNAVGDGVTDDSTAIAAATTAAAGLPVLFPPGTYLCANLSIATPQVNWIGSGAGATIIRGSGGSGSFLSMTDSTLNSWKKFSGIRFSAATGYDQLIFLDGSQNNSFYDCDFDFTNCSVRGMVIAGGPSSRVFARACRFIVPASAAPQLQALNDIHEFHVTSCSFKLAAGFTGHVIDGAGFNVNGCVFDGSALTSACHFVSAEAIDIADDGVYIGTFTGNTFIDNDSDSYAFDLTLVSSDTRFVENGNSFIGFAEPAGSGDSGKLYELSYEPGAIGYQIVLGSRKGRVARINRTIPDPNPFIVSAALVAETVIIHNAATGTNIRYGIDPESLPPGAMAEVFVFNDSGQDNLSITFEMSTTDDGFFPVEIVETDDGNTANAFFRGVILAAGEPQVVCTIAPENARFLGAAGI